MEDAAKHGLANNDGSQTDDNGTASHTDVCKALILAEQCTGQSHQRIGNGQTQHDIEVGVDALCAGHGRVRAGSTDAAAQLRTEEPVQHPDDHRRSKDNHDDGVMQGKFLDPAQGDEQDVFVHIDGLVGLAHDLQVDGIQRQLGQDACQNGGNAHKGVQQAGDKAGSKAGQHSHQQCCPDIHAGKQAHDAHCAAGAKAAVHGQVGYIQNTVGQVHANGHDTPDKPLRTGTR